MYLSLPDASDFRAAQSADKKKAVLALLLKAFYFLYYYYILYLIFMPFSPSWVLTLDFFFILIHILCHYFLLRLLRNKYNLDLDQQQIRYLNIIYVT
jgi:hypothetical protein